MHSNPSANAAPVLTATCWHVPLHQERGLHLTLTPLPDLSCSLPYHVIQFCVCSSHCVAVFVLPRLWGPDCFALQPCWCGHPPASSRAAALPGAFGNTAAVLQGRAAISAACISFGLGFISSASQGYGITLSRLRACSISISFLYACLLLVSTREHSRYQQHRITAM